MKRRLSETADVKSALENDVQPTVATLVAHQVAKALLAPLSGGNGNVARFGHVAFADQEQQNVNAFLHQKLGKDSLTRRPGPGGRKLTYIESCKAIELANRAFGFNGWSCRIVECKEEFKEKKGDRWSIAYSSLVRIELKDGTSHEDVGFGSSEGQRDLAAALEQAKKASVSDARKRALRLFGEYLGNSCYDREHVKDVNANKSMAPLAAAPNVIQVQSGGDPRPPVTDEDSKAHDEQKLKPQQNQQPQNQHPQKQQQHQPQQHHQPQVSGPQQPQQHQPQLVSRPQQHQPQVSRPQQHQQPQVLRPQQHQQHQALRPQQQPRPQQLPPQHQQAQQPPKQQMPPPQPMQQQQQLQQVQHQQQHTMLHQGQSHQKPQWKPPQVMRNMSATSGNSFVQQSASVLPRATTKQTIASTNLSAAHGHSTSATTSSPSTSPFRPQPQRWVSSNAPPPPRMMALNVPPTTVKSERPTTVQAQSNAQYNMEDLSLSQFDYDPSAESINAAKKMRL